MSQPTISIIGAGIAGSTVARCLAVQGISARVYDKRGSEVKTRLGYSHELIKSSYLPLLDILKVKEDDFTRETAVEPENRPPNPPAHFRVQRNKLDLFLRKGLNIKFDHSLESIRYEPDARTSVQVGFKNGESIQSDIVIATDGTHSKFRSTVSPSSRLEILPFVVFNGRRQIKRQIFDERFAPAFQSSTVAEHRVGVVLLQITVTRYDEAHVDISYTYSRPSRDKDALFTPGRPLKGADSVPDELYEEISALHPLDGGLFNEVFNVDAMKQDRILNWLMRSVLVSQADLRKAAEQGVVLIGDAAHHVPILGSYGANVAIEDAVALANHISEHGGKNLADFYTSRHAIWARHVADGKAGLTTMHGEEARAQL